jgi:ribosome-binding protein aMBF1 (putative translation factor)
MPRMAGTRLQRRTLGDKFSEGARQSWFAMERDKLSHAKLAKVLGIAHSTVHKILYGDLLPDALVLIKIEKILKVECKAWAKPPKNHFSPPAARAA